MHRMTLLSKTCLVVGGGGFLGRHLVQYLLEKGRYKVKVLDIAPVVIQGVESIVGDIREEVDMMNACRDVSIVFHVATATPTTENTLNKMLMKSVNVRGTACVIDACIRQGVKKLVYTSSASVVFEGQSLFDADEGMPYATKPLDFYTQTKIEGERLVLAANNVRGLATCALRPSGIFGPGDTLLVPTTVKNVKKGKLKFIIGNGRNMMDFTYVRNVAQAHFMAAEKLDSDSVLAGNAYFVTNQEPQPFWTFLGDICEGLGYPAPRHHLPAILIFIVAYIFEYILRPLLRPVKELSTDFTVSRMFIVTRNRTFSSSKARRDFGYVPEISLLEGKLLTYQAFSHLAAEGPKKAF